MAHEPSTPTLKRILLDAPEPSLGRHPASLRRFAQEESNDRASFLQG
jgi:hypothetical protein